MLEQPSGLALGVTAGVVVAAEVVVELAGGEDVPDGGQDRVFDGSDRAAVTDPGSQALVERLEAAVLGAGRCQRDFLERFVEPLGALARAAGSLLAGRLVVARALPGPRREALVGREDRHVGPDLGEDVLRGAFSDARDRDQQRDGAHAERDKLLLDGVRQAVDLLIEEVQVREDRADRSPTRLSNPSPRILNHPRPRGFNSHRADGRYDNPADCAHDTHTASRGAARYTISRPVRSIPEHRAQHVSRTTTVSHHEREGRDATRTFSTATLFFLFLSRCLKLITLSLPCSF